MTPLLACPALSLSNQLIDRVNREQWLPRLLSEQAWPDGHYEAFGRRFKLPRLQTWHADPGIVYSYSNNLLQTREWTPLLRSIRSAVERATAHRFNAVLVNYYRDENDYVGWHSDDEIELGSAPVIASVSLGSSRSFAFRSKQSPERQCEVLLDNGCLLLMRPDFQSQWEHSVPPARSGTGGRVNLTFRLVYPP